MSKCVLGYETLFNVSLFTLCMLLYTLKNRLFHRIKEMALSLRMLMTRFYKEFNNHEVIGEEKLFSIIP